MMSDHPVILQRNTFYTLDIYFILVYPNLMQYQKLLLKREIIGIQGIGQIRPRFKASFVVWNGDPFSLTSYPILVVAEGKIVHKE